MAANNFADLYSGQAKRVIFMSIRLFDYKEFGAETNKSIIDDFNITEYPEKKYVLEFLRNYGEERCVCGSWHDVVTGELHGTDVLKRYGDFSWFTEIEYYVEKYNFKPRSEFIDFVMSRKYT